MINNFELLALLGWDPVTSLDADHRVSDRDRQGLAESIPSISDNVGADRHHGRVVHLCVLGWDVSAIPGDLGVAHHHLLARNTDLVDSQETIVDRVEANLVTQVANLNVGHGRMRSWRTDLEQERMDAIVLSVEDKTGIDDAVGRSLGQGSWPPFHGVDGGGINLKLIRFGDKSCSSLELAQVGSMGKFRLSIATVGKKGKSKSLFSSSKYGDTPGLGRAIETALPVGSHRVLYHPKIS